MDGNPTQPRKAQLDKEEREHLEDVVTEMRDRVEANVRYQLENKYDLDEKPDDDASLSEEREDLVEAIELEAVDGNGWDDGYEQYITGVGYTIVNRLAALRCMEVRDFIDNEVTAFRDDGLTPAADRLVNEEFMLEEEAVLEAYWNACDDLAEEIDILFDRSTAYSQIDPDDDTFEDLCGILDQVPDDVWRADDVLGWVYEYYNVKLLDDLRGKGDNEGLEPEDVPAANQFYTPHWVVRMLTDNSLGKLYLEDRGELQDTVERQKSLTPDERKNRPLSPDESPDIADFCTYLVSSEEEGEPPEFDGPEDIRVIDPACGSGHFLLYAFDVLERIYRAETGLDHAEIPREILRNNLYGVDLDMRACQLAAFNLYLKGRTRAEAEGANGLDMPEVGIVCADAKVANIEGTKEVFNEVSDGKSNVKDALRRILDAFEEVHGLGSLLDVRGTLGDLFEDDSDQEGVQIKLGDDPREDYTLGQILRSLREGIDQHREVDSFLAQDLRSFVRLLDLLAQDYDVALMNPPYGSRGRMPEVVKKYVERQYEYTPEYYINFFEVCNRLSKPNGRIGMLVPRSFMFRRSFQDFREDFVGQRGSFDFFAEFGYGILDNATVGTAGTIVRSQVGGNSDQTGNFIRLHDREAGDKESTFVAEVLADEKSAVKRSYEIPLREFALVPGTPLTYSVPQEIRKLHSTDRRLDPRAAGLDFDGDRVSEVRTGIQTGDNDRFIRHHWEAPTSGTFKHFTKGGTEAWVLPQVALTLYWGDDGDEIKRHPSSVVRNEEFYGREGLTWTYIKRSGRRFGYFPAGGIFDQKGPMIFPNDVSVWTLMAVLNSDVYHGLFLTLTPERGWNPSDVGRIPWQDFTSIEEQLATLVREQFKAFAALRYTDPKSPLYVGSPLLPNRSEPFYKSGVRSVYPNDLDLQTSKTTTTSDSSNIRDLLVRHKQLRIEHQNRIENISRKIDRIVADEMALSNDTMESLRTEIFLRTIEDEADRELHDSEQVEVSDEEIEREAKRLIHHFSMEAVRGTVDGIIPLNGSDNQSDMLEHIIGRFHAAYDEHAEDRLVEVDGILGGKSAADEAYPNLRSFIKEDLFAYHVDTMENTPIMLKLSTERLLADAKGEGFACFLDYHQLDASLFDRLSNQYLEPRKAELRERRSAANQRQNDQSLSTTERADAVDEFEFCSNALEQIAELEEVMQELGSTSEREFSDRDRECLREIAPKVAEFREETVERIETLERLREMNGEEWFQDTFSEGFWDKVEEWRDEWLDALEELEYACKEYAKPSDEPVEANLADLFDYFNSRLKGSDHYSSTGILFTTYYFEREGSDFLNDDGEPFEKLTQDEKLLASLAKGIDDASVLDEDYLQQIADDQDKDDLDELQPIAEFKALAEEIDDRCQSVYKQIPSDWEERALSEITTAGYQPNQKHGVAINITPLAEKDIVPEIIEDKVI